MANVEATLMISFSDKVLKSLEGFPQPESSQELIHAVPLIVTWNKRNLSVILNSYHAKANLIFVN